MEGDVVFALEVVRLGVWFVPELLPVILVGRVDGPCFGGGKVSDYSLEPDIDAFLVVALKTMLRNWNTPFDVAGHRAVVEAFVKETNGLIADVRSPFVLVGYPFFERLLEGAQLDHQVCSLFEDWRRSVTDAADFDQIGRVESTSAVIALITTCAVISTHRANALDESIR